MNVDFHWLLQTIITSGVVSGGIGLWFKSRVDRELEREKTRYSWLYQARAQSMMAIYSQLIAVEKALDLFIHMYDLQPCEETVALLLARHTSFADSVTKLDDLYKPDRLLFTSDIGKRLDEFSGAYHSALVTFDSNMDAEYWYHDALEALQVATEKRPDTTGLLRDIETEFRTIYGVTEGKRFALKGAA